MGEFVFLSYWLFGLRLPALEFVVFWVELALGAMVRTSGRPHSNEYSLGSEVLCYSSGLDLKVPLEELQSNPWFMNQDPASHMGWQKTNKQTTKKELNTNKE